MAEAYPADQPRSQKRDFSPFALLKVAVSDYLLREQLEQLAVLFELSPREHEQFNNNAAPGLAFIRILEERCFFTATCVDRFINGLIEIRNIQLAKIVEEYKRDHISNLGTNISGSYQSYYGVGNRRMEGTSMDLENSLLCNIILQNPDGIEKSVEGAMQQLLDKGSKINHKSVKRLFPQQTPNQFQSQALRRALSQPFTVIQGPPGTGKTRTGAYLTAFFAKLNKENKKLFQESGDKPPQILYCGPSNKSVDVIAQFLQKLSKTVKLSFVRVYGDSIEQQIFPVPGVEGAERKFTYFEDRHMPEEVKKNALHHLIRSEEAGVDGKAIKDMDRKFKEGKLEPSLNAVRHYKDVVKRTKIKILKSRDIILCTCNAAGHFILKGNLNIVQCIIDEAGMCFELDNLIPLVCQRPKQVVLIGDHKQLRPIIQHPRAKQLGAEISLMEKYKESAYTIRTQYRMVRIVRYLLEKLKVDRENLVVLSQYKLQCSLLREKLRGLRVSVHTIIKSQGSEWDFVLLSTVRSLPDDEIPERPGRSWRRKYLGYIEDENQMNVGITRARQGLIIVGNKYLLATCSKWKKLIQHYEKTGSVVDAENFLKQPRN